MHKGCLFLCFDCLLQLILYNFIADTVQNYTLIVGPLHFFLVCDESGQPPEAIVAIRTQDLFDIPHGCSQQYKVEYIKQSSEPSAI